VKLNCSAWFRANATVKNLEKLTVAQEIKQFPAFYEIRRFIAVFTSSSHWTNLNLINPLHILKIHFLNIHFKIVAIPKHRSPKWQSHSRFSTTILQVFLIPPMHDPFPPVYSPWFDSHNIWRRVGLTNYWVPYRAIFSTFPLRPLSWFQIFLSVLFWNIFSLFFIYLFVVYLTTL
jgi:hypothetical protein